MIYIFFWVVDLTDFCFEVSNFERSIFPFRCKLIPLPSIILSLSLFEYSSIISKIDEHYQVVMSAKVIDELDKLKIKLDAANKKNVETALRLINKAMDKPNVSMELSDPDLLPNDFNKKSPDNNILTVALKFKNENPILLTSDNGLQVKAKGLRIATITLKDFLN